MSDFIFSKKRMKQGELSKEIKAIYHEDSPPVREFHGEWGSLAVSDNLYDGFQAYENKSHICIVLGGPLLTFLEKQNLGKNSQTARTEAVYNRFLTREIIWDTDLSGPFAILIVNKQTAEICCMTDLMSFIPVFIFNDDSEQVMLSTHVDMLARAAGQQEHSDPVSMVDFVLNGIVTYPYTAYKNIKQLAPASIHFLKNNRRLTSEPYWLPEESKMYHSMGDAAVDLRLALQKYVDLIAADLPKMAHFISGGEDSRALCGLLPKTVRREAFIFLDEMNREGEVAKKAATAYGSHFNLVTRSKVHYLEILPSCADLVGKGSQYIHAHTFGFHKKCRLNEYCAVFGGLFSDALLKGARIKKWHRSGRFPFLPQIKNQKASAGIPLRNAVFHDEVLNEVTKRRQAHLAFVKGFRNKSAEEWFELWPSSMNVNIPNIHVNRRLFQSYEPFMCSEVVKISAAVPQKWKLNRRLFHKMAKPWLKPTKWLLHGEGGSLPYFPWYINTFIAFVVWFFRKVGIRLGKIRGNHGPWTEWETVLKSQEWQQAIHQYSDGITDLSLALKNQDIKQLFQTNHLTTKQKINLLQAMKQGSKQ